MPIEDDHRLCRCIPHTLSYIMLTQINLRSILWQCTWTFSNIRWRRLLEQAVGTAEVATEIAHVSHLADQEQQNLQRFSEESTR